MVYDYMVNFAGTYYPAGTNVPDDEPVKDEPKVEEPIVDLSKPFEQELEQKAEEVKRKGGRPRKKA